MNKPVYKVAPGHIVSSNKYQKDFHEGEILDLSHLSGADIAALLASGAVLEEVHEVIKEPIKKEVNHGKTDTD